MFWKKHKKDHKNGAAAMTAGCMAAPITALRNIDDLSPRGACDEMDSGDDEERDCPPGLEDSDSSDHGLVDRVSSESSGTESSHTWTDMAMSRMMDSQALP